MPRKSPPRNTASLNETSGISLMTSTSRMFWPISQPIDAAIGSIQGSRPPMISNKMLPSAVSEVMLTPRALMVRTERVNRRCARLVRTGSSRTWFQ